MRRVVIWIVVMAEAEIQSTKEWEGRYVQRLFYPTNGKNQNPKNALYFYTEPIACGNEKDGYLDSSDLGS